MICNSSALSLFFLLLHHAFSWFLLFCTFSDSSFFVLFYDKLLLSIGLFGLVSTVSVDFFILSLLHCNMFPTKHPVMHWISSNWLRFGTVVDCYMLISILILICFPNFFHSYFFWEICLQNLKFSKLTEIFFRRTLLYTYYNFNFFFFKNFLSHIYNLNVYFLQTFCQLYLFK